MPVKFNEFIFKNNNGIQVTVVLANADETPIQSFTVAPTSATTVHPNLNNVQSLLIMVSPGAHSTEKQKIDLANSINPYQLFIEMIEVEYTIGSLKGNIKSSFNYS